MPLLIFIPLTNDFALFLLLFFLPQDQLGCSVTVVRVWESSEIHYLSRYLYQMNESKSCNLLTGTWQLIYIYAQLINTRLCCPQLQSAKDAVKTVLDHMTNPKTSTHLTLPKGETWQWEWHMKQVKVWDNTRTFLSRVHVTARAVNKVGYKYNLQKLCSDLQYVWLPPLVGLPTNKIPLRHYES